MKILVTGGKGVVGSNLVSRLEDEEHDVWVCDLKHSHEAKYIRCDVAKYRQLEEVFARHRFDFVYHLAAEFGRWNGEDYYEDLWMTNAIGTKNMLRLQEKCGFKMIFTSSSEVYGDYQDLMTEDIMNELEIKQMNDYAISKWANELQIMNSIEMSGNQVVRVRLFNTYGPGEFYTPYRSAVAIFIYKALHDLPYTVYLNHQRSSIYIDDCSEALVRIMERFKSGEVYNIAGNEQHDMKLISDMILSYMAKDDDMVQYEQCEKHTTRIKLPDNYKTASELGFKPVVKLRDGIPRTIEWMKGIYNIK